MASKRVNPAKKSKMGFQVVEIVRTRRAREIENRMSLPDLLIFFPRPLAVPFAKRLMRYR
jgi:hypothetical protein